MWTFGQLQLSKIKHVKEATLDLDYKGVTVIKGRNLRSKIKGRSNGAGKTLLISAVADLVTNSNPTHDKNKQAVKNSLLGAGSCMSLDITNNQGSSYTITKGKKGKSYYCTVADNQGKDLGLVTNSKAESYIHSLFPISKEEFYSTIYINARKHSVLYYGTDTDRYKYFDNLFHLHDYDALKEFFVSERSKLYDLESRRDFMLEQLQPLEKYKGFDKREAKTNIKKAKKELRSLDKKLSKLSTDIGDVSLYNKYRKKLGYYSDDLKSVKKELGGIKYCIAEHEAYNKYKSALESWSTSKKSLEKKIKGYKKDASKWVKSPTAKSLKTFRDEAKSKQDNASKQMNSCTKRYDSICSSIKEYEFNKKKLKSVKKKIKSIKIVSGGEPLKMLLTHKKHLTAFLSGEGSASSCSVCGSDFTVKQAKARLKKLEKSIKAQRLNEKHLSTKTKLEKQLAVLKAQTKDIDAKALVKEKKKVAAEIQELKGLDSIDIASIDNLLKRWSTASTELKKLNKPSTVKAPDTDLKELKARRKKLRTIAKVTESLSPIYDQIISGKKLSAKLDGDKAKDKTKELNKKRSALVSTISELQTNLTTGTRGMDDYSELSRKIKKANKQLEDIDIFDALIEAYGTKGLKVIAVKRIAAAIQKNLNRYSHTLFPEDFEFSLEVKNNNVSILCTRKTGKDQGSGTGTETDDIRHLSGAEALSFELLWLISLLPMIPDNRRANILVLDECQAGLDPATSDLMCNEFLPALSSIVPHIIFITPYDYSDIPYARTLIIEKGKDGVGRLVEDKK